MAQVRLLKFGSVDNLATEFISSTDEITMLSFSVDGGGPVLSGTGLGMNNQDVSDVNDLAFNNPASGTINQTAGALIVDNIMAKERTNVITSAGAIQFSSISDAVGEVDSLVLPKLAGAPTAVPTAGEGSFLYDTTNDKLWLYTTAGWDDLSTVSSTNSVDNEYTAEVTLAIRDVVYISSADNVSKADSDAGAASSRAIGFALAAASAAAPVTIRSGGIVPGFTGLTAGAPYYVSATAGAITATAPSGAGVVRTQVGYAKSTTALAVQIQRLGVTSA